MGSNSARIPIDLKLYDAVSKGNIRVLDFFLQAESVGDHAQPNEVPVTMEGGAHLQRSRSEGGASLQRRRLEGELHLQRNILRVAHQRVSCLLGVTHTGDTALHIATRFGQLEVATRICDKNVSLLTRENDMLETPLHCAAKAGKHELVALFIERATTETSNINMGELLRKRNKDGETAFYQSILHNHETVVTEFVTYAATNQIISSLASIPDNKNISPLYLAVMLGQLAIVTKLIESFPRNVYVSGGAYVGPNGQTALHVATLRTGDFVQKLLNWRPALATFTDESGNTPLHYAASCDNLEAVKIILLTDITSAYMADSSGLFAVYIAVRMGFVKVVDEIFTKCPDSVKLRDKKGRNFVHFAVEEKSESIVQWICNKSELFAEAMNAQDDNGDTGIHLAIRVEHINIFARLLGTKRVLLYAVNKEGLTPYALAMSMRTVGFYTIQNPNLMMLRVLSLIGYAYINRRDHFKLEHNQQYDQKKEKLVESFENIARNIALGSILIASAAFAGAFSVSGVYKTDINNGHNSPGVSLAFKFFILTVSYAFVCSITATSLLVDAAAAFVVPTYRAKYIVVSFNLIKLAVQGFVAAFAIGLYVILSLVSKWLASLVCLAGAIVPFVLQPHLRPNRLVTLALIRHLGWRGLYLGTAKAFWVSILHGIIVLLILLCSFLPTDCLPSWVKKIFF